MTTIFTTNLTPNGSFETSLTGYSALSGSSILRVSADALSGQYSMQVTTAGEVAGEGFTGPAVAFTDVTGPCGMQASFSGETGSLLVSAIVPSEGGSPATVLGQVTVSLTPAWQTIELNDLAVPDGNTAYLVVQTPTAQPLTFLVDCVQYEPESPAHAYIDGSLPGCEWTGTPFNSASIQPYEFFQILVGGTVTGGSIESVSQGENFLVILPAGTTTVTGSIAANAVSPAAAFTDFALFELTDPDPAQTYVSWNTAGMLTGLTSYSRPWGIFYPPLDYPVSGGELLWPRAAYIVEGFELSSVPAGSQQNLTAVQVEMIPLAGTNELDETPSPASYDLPRSVHLIVKPTRLNYATVPDFAVAPLAVTLTEAGFVNAAAALSATLPVTSGKSVPAKNGVLLVVTVPAAAAFTISDTQSNAYSLAGAAPGPSGQVTYAFTSFGVNGLSSANGDKLTIGQSVSQTMEASLYTMPYVTGIDSVTVAQGTSAAPSVALAGQNGYNDFEVVVLANNSAVATTAVPSGWTHTVANFGEGNLHSDVFARTASGGFGSDDTCTSAYGSSVAWSGIAVSFLASNAVTGNWWSASGAATISPAGAAVFHSAADSVSLLVPDLIVGDDFTASLQAVVPAGVADVQLSVGSQTGGVPGADDTGATDLTPGTVQPELTFSAPASTVVLYVAPLLGENGTWPVTIDLSQILIEAGQLVGSYFDGNFGNPDYTWGGVAGLSQSFYFENYQPGQVVVSDILTRQIPMSISAADPEYAQPPTQ